MMKHKALIAMVASLCSLQLLAMDVQEKETQKKEQHKHHLRSLVRLHQTASRFRDAAQKDQLVQQEPQQPAQKLIQVQGLSISPDSKHVATLICPSDESNFNETYAVVYCAQKGEIEYERSMHEQKNLLLPASMQPKAPNMFCIAYNPTGDLIATGGYKETPGGDRALIHIYDEKLEHLLRTYENELGEVISFSWKNHKLLAASFAQFNVNAATAAANYVNGRITVFNAEDGTTSTHLDCGNSKNFIAADDGDSIVAVDEQAMSHYLYRACNGQVTTIELPDKGMQLQRAAFSPNSEYLACAGKPGDDATGILYLINNKSSAADNNSGLIALNSHDGDASDTQIKRISFSCTDKGRFVAYADANGGDNNYGSLCIFDIQTSKLVEHLRMYLDDAQLAPNGKFVAIAGAGGLHLIPLDIHIESQLRQLEQGIGE